MSAASLFLIALGQCLATMGLYADSHPARQRAVDTAWQRLQRLLEEEERVAFSFLGGETISGERVLLELGLWEWASRLASVGIERLEVERTATAEQFERFVDDAWRLLQGQGDDTTLARQFADQSIRWGVLSVRGARKREGEVPVDNEASTLVLNEETSTVGWLHETVRNGADVPLREAETVVRSLALAMRAEQRMFLPLLELRRFDEYTTTHACNVAVLAMGLAERLRLTRDQVRDVGVAGLLHDIGKVKIPIEILTKPGKLTDQEREIMQRHPVDGAKLVLEQQKGLDLAAVVAYEHHVCLDGGGYPRFRFARDCHYSSRIVHVCDIYDALCTNRPYRGAWEPERALGYLVEKSGTEVETHIVETFASMIRESATARMTLDGAEVEAA